MSHAVSIDAIKLGLVERIDTLVPELFPNAHRAGREWVMGDVHGSPGASLSICRVGHKAGWWRDFGGTAKGDILDLFAAGACEGDVKAAVGRAIQWLGLGHLSDPERRERERRAELARERRARDQAQDADAARRRARGHWHSAVPIAGTPADRYLLGRSIDIRRLAKPPGSLRYKPMRCPETERDRPCMLAIVNDGRSGAVLAIHRTFLDVLPDGRVVKAAMRDPKRAYGPFAGGFIPLARGASGRPILAAPAGEWLTLSEGIEDGLSVALAVPDRRVGAALSLSNIGGLTLPDAIGGLCIAGQNDIAATPIAALDGARRRLDERGIATSVVRPPAGVKDWNDWLRALDPVVARECVA